MGEREEGVPQESELPQGEVDSDVSPGSLTPARSAGNVVASEVIAMMRGSFGQPNIVDRITSSQLDSLISQTGRESELEHSRQMHSQYITFASLVVLAVLLAFVFWLFLSYQQGDLLREIIALLIGFGAGGVSGYMYRSPGENNNPSP